MSRRPRPRGVKVDCSHATAHEHGTRNAYALDSCTCEPCCTAAHEYEAARWAARPDAVKTGEARTHVTLLRARGMSLDTIARAAHVRENVVRTLVNANANGALTTHMSSEHSAALLSVPAPTLPVQPDAHAPGFGARRRLRALVADGHGVDHLARALNITTASMHRLLTQEPALREDFIERAADIYALWRHLNPEGPHVPTRQTRMETLRARNLAATHGWAPPSSWGERAIDEDTGAPLRHDAPPRVDVDEVARLLAWGTIPSVIARRLGTNVPAIAQAARRANRAEVANQFSKWAA